MEDNGPLGSDPVMNRGKSMVGAPKEVFIALQGTEEDGLAAPQVTYDEPAERKGPDVPPMPTTGRKQGMRSCVQLLQEDEYDKRYYFGTIIRRIP